jgi:nucleoside-diphosphate-sugar epimerase
VYADHSRPYSEASPLAELEDPDIEDVWPNYGALKAACERVLDDIYDDRATHVRAGLIVGPFDPTNRFTYWPVCLAEGGDVLVPDVPERLVQFIDARDLARWMLTLALQGPGGPMNATGPARPTTMENVVTRIGSDLGTDCRFHWIDSALLVTEGVSPWGELPLWLPGAEYEGLLQADVRRALAAGLTPRPLEETARDTLAWVRTAGEQRPTLTRDREKELLQKYAGSANS